MGKVIQSKGFHGPPCTSVTFYRHLSLDLLTAALCTAQGSSSNQNSRSCPKIEYEKNTKEPREAVDKAEVAEEEDIQRKKKRVVVSRKSKMMFVNGSQHLHEEISRLVTGDWRNNKATKTTIKSYLKLYNN